MATPLQSNRTKPQRRVLAPDDWRNDVYGATQVTGGDRRRYPRKVERDRVIDRQGNACLYCGLTIGTLIWRRNRVVRLVANWDHFVPYAYCARNDGANWVLACHVCNRIKAARMFDTVQQARDAILPARRAKGYDAPNALSTPAQPQRRRAHARPRMRPIAYSGPKVGIKIDPQPTTLREHFAANAGAIEGVRAHTALAVLTLLAQDHTYAEIGARLGIEAVQVGRSLGWALKIYGMRRTPGVIQSVAVVSRALACGDLEVSISQKHPQLLDPPLRDALGMIADGRSNKYIRASLSIGPATFMTSVVTPLFAALGVPRGGIASRLMLVLAAFTSGELVPTANGLSLAPRTEAVTIAAVQMGHYETGADR